MKNKTEARSYMLSRFRDVHRKLKIVEVIVSDETVDVKFEKNYTLRLNKAEAEVLKVKVDAD